MHFVQAPIYNFLLFDIARKGKMSKWMNFIVGHWKENKTIILLRREAQVRAVPGRPEVGQSSTGC